MVSMQFFSLRLRFADKNLNDESDDFLKLERRVSNVTRHPKYRREYPYADTRIIFTRFLESSNLELKLFSWNVIL